MWRLNGVGEEEWGCWSPRATALPRSWGFLNPQRLVRIEWCVPIRYAAEWIWWWGGCRGVPERHAISFFAWVSAGFQPAVTRQDGRHPATSESRLWGDEISRLAYFGCLLCTKSIKCSILLYSKTSAECDCFHSAEVLLFLCEMITPRGDGRFPLCHHHRLH